MPHYLFELVEQALRTTLYMVQEWGPTSFTFKDQNEHKVKVTLGASICCSCHPGRNDHCLHSLYLLLKMFRVDRSNPILWQAGYLDSELKALCDGKYRDLKGRREPLRPQEKRFSDGHLEDQPEGV
jgi:E3 ubiquitin-protein ligase ZSWIM2